MRNVAADIVTYSFIVGGILVFTKPGSQGVGFVAALFNGFTHLVQGATGQATSQVRAA